MCFCPFILPCVMPAGMFSIDSILAGRPTCKDSVLIHRNAPVVFPNLTDSLYTAAEYNTLYAHTGPSTPSLQSVNGTRIGYNNYYYGQLHVQGPSGPACCGAIPTLGSQQCPCIPTGRLRVSALLVLTCLTLLETIIYLKLHEIALRPPKPISSAPCLNYAWS